MRRLFSGVLPLFIIAHFGHHLLTALPIPLLPLIRSDFGLDYTQSGLVISAFSLSYGVGQLPAGWLADRIGPRIMITVGICGVAVAGFLVGLSQTYIMMIVFLALMGLAGGGYHPASPSLISASVEPKNRGRALGVHMIGGSASFFLAPLIAAVIAATWGWRGSFIGLAVPTMIFGIMFYVFLGRTGTTKKAEDKTTSSYIDTPAPCRWRHLVTFIILTRLPHAVLLSTMSFIPLYLVDHFGTSEGTAAASMALIYSAGLWASPLGGYLSDRWGSVSVILAAYFIAAPVIYLLNLAPYGLGIGALLLTIGMIVYVCSPASQAYIVRHTSEHNRSTILGIYFFGSMEGSGIVTPVMGYLIDQLGFYLSFTIAGAAVLAITLICSIWLWGSRD